MYKFNPSEINDKIKKVFESLNCAAKVILALGFALRNMDTDQFQ